MALADIIGLGVAPIARYRAADRAKMDDYKAQTEAYNTAVDQYNRQLEDFKAAYDPWLAKVQAFNTAVEEWNAGPRTSDYAGPESPGEWTGGEPPSTPSALPFTEDDITAFQEQAKGRAIRGANTLGTAYSLFGGPGSSVRFGAPQSGTDIEFSFAGSGFAEGGPVYNQYPTAPMYNQPPAGIGSYMPYMPSTYADGGAVEQGIGSLPEASYGFGGFVKKIVKSLPGFSSSSSAPAASDAKPVGIVAQEINTAMAQQPVKTGGGFLARALRAARLRKQNALFRQQQAAEQAAKIASMNAPPIAMGPVISSAQALPKDDEGVGGLFASLIKKGPFM